MMEVVGSNVQTSHWRPLKIYKNIIWMSDGSGDHCDCDDYRYNFICGVRTTYRTTCNPSPGVVSTRRPQLASPQSWSSWALLPRTGDSASYPFPRRPGNLPPWHCRIKELNESLINDLKPKQSLPSALSCLVCLIIMYHLILYIYSCRY